MFFNRQSMKQAELSLQKYIPLNFSQADNTSKKPWFTWKKSDKYR